MNFYSDKQLYKIIESNRRLFLQKDLFDLLQWIEHIEHIDTELNAFSTLNKHLLKNQATALKIQTIRRKNTLTMRLLCKYEQYIKRDIEYGKDDYDLKKTKEHEKHRALIKDMDKEFRQLKFTIYQMLSQFKR